MHKLIKAYSSAVWLHVAHTTSASCYTEAIKKAIFLLKKLKNFLGESQENGPLAERKNTGESRRNRRTKVFAKTILKDY